MGLFTNLFTKNNSTNTKERVGGMEDFMTLIRVYYQAVMASNLGITNLAALPDMAIFKRTLKVATTNNKLGIAEKSRSKKMLKELYGMTDVFFKEIDASIKKNCRTINDVKNYLYMFQGFSQDLMMLVGNLMKWKFRMPSIFKKVLYQMTAKTINDILTRNNWKDDAVRKTCGNVRRYHQMLGYSGEWMTEYVYHIVILAKKEPRPKDED